MSHGITALSCLAIVLIPFVAYADFADDLRAAATTIETVMPKAGELLDRGQLDESIAVVTKLFPESKRTVAQS